ncbi:MAG: corrinoid protein [Actinobacteria bacterium]|nr:corrinoid protein [Actinomycetota bacterium]
MLGEELMEAIIEGRIDDTPDITRALLDDAVSPKEIMDKYMIPAMQVVGEKFEEQEYFVPEVLVAAHAMQASLALVEPLLAQSDERPTGKVVIGTVKGDLHEIGKNIVAMMLQGAGFQVNNLGVDVSSEAFVAAVEEIDADILGMSSLLTTAMRSMQDTIDMLLEAGIRERIKVIVGGAAITPEFARRIGADVYCEDANEAVKVARELCS